MIKKGDFLLLKVKATSDERAGSPKYGNLVSIGVKTNASHDAYAELTAIWVDHSGIVEHLPILRKDDLVSITGRIGKYKFLHQLDKWAVVLLENNVDNTPPICVLMKDVNILSNLPPDKLLKVDKLTSNKGLDI